jgi:hypothetical protein
MTVYNHGRLTVIKLDGDDLSEWTDTSELDREAGSHQVTAYGATAHNYEGGLLDGKATMSGTYGSAAGGPRATIRPLLGTKVTLIRQPEGTGSGKPQDSVTVLVLRYVETNPVADMIKWSCEMQMSSAVDSTAQS